MSQNSARRSLTSKSNSPVSADNSSDAQSSVSTIRESLRPFAEVLCDLGVLKLFCRNRRKPLIADCAENICGARGEIRSGLSCRPLHNVSVQPRSASILFRLTPVNSISLEWSCRCSYCLRLVKPVQEIDMAHFTQLNLQGNSGSKPAPSPGSQGGTGGKIPATNKPPKKQHGTAKMLAITGSLVAAALVTTLTLGTNGCSKSNKPAIVAPTAAMTTAPQTASAAVPVTLSRHRLRRRR